MRPAATFRRSPRWGRATAALFALLPLVAGCQTSSESTESHSPGRIAVRQLDETSGIAASRRTAGRWWAVNDSGNPPHLYCLDATGADRGRVVLTGATNRDWEDLASFVIDGEAWLVIADVGDNLGVRNDAALLFVREPSPGEMQPGAVIQRPVEIRIPLRYPDEPLDCEAVAVDVSRREILLLSKRTRPPRVYRLPLQLAASDPQTAVTLERLGPVEHIPEPNPLQQLNPSPAGRWRAQPTGLDVTADGRVAAVLTYGDVWLYPREGDESWADAFRRPPEHVGSLQLTQAEAIAFNADGTALIVVSEGTEAELREFSVPTRRAP